MLISLPRALSLQSRLQVTRLGTDTPDLLVSARSTSLPAGAVLPRKDGRTPRCNQANDEQVPQHPLFSLASGTGLLCYIPTSIPATQVWDQLTWRCALGKVSRDGPKGSLQMLLPCHVTLQRLP